MTEYVQGVSESHVRHALAWFLQDDRNEMIMGSKQNGRQDVEWET